MLEVKRADGTRVRGCFALRQRLPAGWSFTSPLFYAGGDFLRAAETWINFSNQERPHEGLDTLSPLHSARAS